MSAARVLIVDDNQELAENVAEILSASDTDVLCEIAPDGFTALERCRQYGVDLDLAVVDLQLPDRSGLQLLEEARRHCPCAQIVILTGSPTLESAVAAVGAKVFAYVLKPFQPVELLGAARRALEHTRALRRADELRAELESSERRHREVVEGIPAFVVALDGSGQIVLWSRRLEEVTGFSRAEMLGQAGRDWVQDGGEHPLPIKAGGSLLVRWKCTQVADSAAGSALTYAIGIDVTEEVQMLRRAMRAERLAAVGTLAAGLAHEVRNPLNSATLQLQVLRRRIERGGAETASLLSVVQLVHDEIRRLERLVGDFLAFAQPQRLDLHPADLNELLGSVSELVRPECEAQGVELALELDPDVGTVELESERMRQVLLNLLRNAVEAMPEGGRLSVRSAHRQSDFVAHIEIEDTGVGFPENAPIFDAFFTTKAKGTGLGLAIAHRIVSEHGGQLQAVSSPGCTRFTIDLPQAPVRTPDTRA